MKLTSKQPLNVAPPLTLREYLATLAPDEVADWYQPESKTPAPVCPTAEAFGVPEAWRDYATYWAVHVHAPSYRTILPYGCPARPEGNQPESVERFKEAGSAWDRAVKDWRRANEQARATSWPWAWADLVLAARGEPAK